MNSDLSKAHCTYIMEHYPKIRQLDICIREFRNIYDQKNMVLLYLFIEKYKLSEIQYRNYPTLQRGLKKILKQSKIRLQARCLMDLLKGQKKKKKW